jgi:SAM-dependent methyltransferase
MAQEEAKPLGARLSDADYLRRRLDPPASDMDQLILLDVLAAVRRFATGVEGAVLDFGSGGAPYRVLFPRVSRYVAADVTPGPGVDVLIAGDGSTGLPDESFDAVLSTQVLEHVADVAGYLREARRVLRPRGRMLVTTHGLFPEHGCPHDFRRWTAVGLADEARRNDFVVDGAWKLTAGARGSIQMLHYALRGVRLEGRPATDKLLGILRRLHRGPGVWLANRFAAGLHDLGIVPAEHPAEMFVGVAVELRKPL